ncbi:polyketide synthase dehydratase domain-containing protein, partial [Streptomyces sp. MBT97]|uniref:polyketide synthase dehydratase domain-containing protein n=1 Tax=Streptomyces sp. MBT97 TaxID=2800411 RepID=UPI00190D6096
FEPVAAESARCDRLEELTLEAPLVLSADGAVQLQVTVSARDDDGRRDIEIHSRPEAAEADDDGAPWTRHASGTLTGLGTAAPAAVEPTLGVWPPAGGVRVDVQDFYERVGDAGYEYGPAFRGVRSAWRVGEEVFAEVALPEEQARDAGRFGLHPALLDAALHPVLLARLDQPGGTSPGRAGRDRFRDRDRPRDRRRGPHLPVLRPWLLRVCGAGREPVTGPVTEPFTGRAPGDGDGLRRRDGRAPGDSGRPRPRAVLAR